MNAVLFKQRAVPQLIGHPRIFFPLVEQHAKAEGKHRKLSCQMSRSPVIYDKLDGFVLLFTIWQDAADVLVFPTDFLPAGKERPA